MRHALLAVLSVCAALTTIPGAQSLSRFELDEMSVTQLQDAMATGMYTSRRLVDLYSQRIDDIDRNGPTLRAVIAVNPDAPSIAEALDAERTARGPRGPLHGIPVLIKDNIDTADRMATTAGSLALEGSIAARDAYVVQRLRVAGAVILGKTNLSEWANFRSTKSASGWSALGGQTRNPYILDRNACGSSSGTAVAIAASMAAVGVGTETDGSIVCPASVNALVGLKPTVGLVGRSGIIPISRTQDTAGPMARTVADAAALLNAMTGRDPGDAMAGRRSVTASTDFTTALDARALKGARIGVVRKRYFGYSPATDRLANAAIARMKEQGAVIVDPADIPTAAQLDDCEFDILLYEFKADLNAYLKQLGPHARVRNLADLMAFNEREQSREMPFFGQEIFELAQKKGPLTSPAYRKALSTCRSRSRAQGIDAVMSAYRLDALVAPTGGPAWPIDPVNGDHYLGSSSTAAAVAGYPSITVPAGFAHGLPVGISFIGRPWSDAKLLALAFAYEQATRHRRPPQFLATLRTAR